MTGSRVARARALVRNVALTVSTGAGHLVEDPLLFAVQLGRRMPAGVRSRAARTFGGGRGLTAATALWWADRPAEATTLLEGLARPRSRAGRRWAAEAALVLSRADLAERFMPEGPAVVRGRAAWSRGDLSGAVDAVSVPGAGRAGARLARRYAGELVVLDPAWEPERPTVRAATPGGGPLRVFHVLTNSVPHTSSGYTSRTHSVLSALVASGVEVEAATRLAYPVSVGRWRAQDVDVVDGVRYGRVLPARLPRTAPERLSTQVRMLAPRVAAFAPRVLHTTTDHTNGLVTRSLAGALGLPWVYEVRGLLEESWVARQPPVAQAAAEASERRAAWRARESELARSADHVVTLGVTLAEELRARGVAAERITVVPNGVDPAVLAEGPRARDARETLGLDRGGFWVGTVSSLVDYEGLDTMLEAVAVLRARGVDARVLVVGDGTSRAGWERRAHDLDLGGACVFTGRVARGRAATMHRALDVFAVPRRDVRVCRMVTPLKPVEAMAVGRPVVASDLPALAEIVVPSEDGVGAAARPRAATGVLAPAGDVDAWADAFGALADDVDLRERLGTAGREFASTRTWAGAAGTLRDVYERLGAA